MRHTRTGVIERTRAEYAELDRLVKRLKPADWRRRVPRPEGKDPWTVKDALAHIVYWKEHTERYFRGAKRPDYLKGIDVSGINAVIYRRWRSRPPSDVVDAHKRIQKTVLKTLRATPEEFFTRREHNADWPGDFTSHSRWHRIRDIEAAITKSDR
jgi:Mycothiol maleylpyruvate isomerase N-terminal domain